MIVAKEKTDQCTWLDHVVLDIFGRYSLPVYLFFLLRWRGDGYRVPIFHDVISDGPDASTGHCMQSTGNALRKSQYDCNIVAHRC